jgi:hypothetical protein
MAYPKKETKKGESSQVTFTSASDKSWLSSEAADAYLAHPYRAIRLSLGLQGCCVPRPRTYMSREQHDTVQGIMSNILDPFLPKSSQFSHLQPPIIPSSETGHPRATTWRNHIWNHGTTTKLSLVRPWQSQVRDQLISKDKRSTRILQVSKFHTRIGISKYVASYSRRNINKQKNSNV